MAAPGILIDDWHIDNTGGTFEATAQFYSLSQTVPQRGTTLLELGTYPAGYQHLVVADYKVTPLSGRGPYIIEVTAKPRAGFSIGSGDSLQNKRNAILETRPYKVRRGQLESWPSKFSSRGLRHSATYPFQFAVLDYYVNGAWLGGASGIVHASTIPAWTGLDTTHMWKWRTFSKKNSFEYDTDGSSALKHIVVELIGVPASLNSYWDDDYYGVCDFADL